MGMSLNKTELEKQLEEIGSLHDIAERAKNMEFPNNMERFDYIQEQFHKRQCIEFTLERNRLDVCFTNMEFSVVAENRRDGGVFFEQAALFCDEQDACDYARVKSRQYSMLDIPTYRVCHHNTQIACFRDGKGQKIS